MDDLRVLVGHVHRKRAAPAAAAPSPWLDWPLDVLADDGCNGLPRGDSALDLAMTSVMAPDGHPDELLTEWAAPVQPGVDGPWF